MSAQLILYVELEGDSPDQIEELEEAIRGLQDVSGVETAVEEPERGAVEVIQSITLTVTALGGAVAASDVLIDRVRELLAKFRVKSAQVETSEGLRELPVGGEPTKENPAQ